MGRGERLEYRGIEVDLEARELFCWSRVNSTGNLNLGSGKKAWGMELGEEDRDEGGAPGEN